jgi:cytochrome c oxidase assembly factor CtaG
VVLVAAGVAYGLGVWSAHRHGHRWPLRRTAAFYLLGLGSFAVICFGFLGAYSEELRWAFTTRIALLLFVVPSLVSLGTPATLARLALVGRGQQRLDAFLSSRFMRFVGNAVFEPLFTLAVFLLFLTPLSGLLRLSPLGQDLVSVVVPLVGMLMVIPIMENTRRNTGLFLTFEFILAFVALVFDAIPGILIRLNDMILDHAPAAVGVLPPWFPSPIRDQQLSGDLLWFFAEVADIPVLIILFVRWSRTDKREAKSLDDLSDEEMEALTREHLNRRG